MILFNAWLLSFSITWGLNPIPHSVEVPGKILLHPEHVTVVDAPDEGKIVEILKKRNDSVEEGEIVALYANGEPIVSPVKGVILKCSIEPGESVHRTRQLFVIGDLTHLWIDLRVPEKDLLRKGTWVHFMTDKGVEGSARLLEGSIADLDNTLGQFTPGTRVKVVVQKNVDCGLISTN